MVETQAQAAPPAETAQDIPGTYRRVFFRGLATLLPTVLTFWVFVSVYGFIDGKIATPIAGLIKQGLVETETGNSIAISLFDLPQNLKVRIPPDGTEPARKAEARRHDDLKQYVDQRFPSWVGFLLAIVAVFIVGFFIASFVGRTLWG